MVLGMLALRRWLRTDRGSPRFLVAALWIGSTACALSPSPPAAAPPANQGSGPGPSVAERECEQGSAAACTAHGRVVEGSDYRHLEEAGRWYLKGCALGDVNGCEHYGWAGYNGQRMDVAAEGFAKACKLEHRASCHMLGKILLAEPATRAAAAAVFEENCSHGFGGSCTGGAVALAPLLSPLGNCARAAPLAEKTCRSKVADACAVSDACKLAEDAERAAATERLRTACDRKVALACFYWADVQPAAAGEPERLRGAYEIACRANSLAAPVACLRLAALHLAAAKTPAEGERLLASLSKACDRSIGEACCLLAEAHATITWVAPDPSRVQELRKRACALGQSRCCPRP